MSQNENNGVKTVKEAALGKMILKGEYVWQDVQKGNVIL